MTRLAFMLPKLREGARKAILNYLYGHIEGVSLEKLKNRFRTEAVPKSTITVIMNQLLAAGDVIYVPNGAAKYKGLYRLAPDKWIEMTA